jgi:hypothetical protein
MAVTGDCRSVGVPTKRPSALSTRWLTVSHRDSWAGRIMRTLVDAPDIAEPSCSVAHAEASPRVSRSRTRQTLRPVIGRIAFGRSRSACGGMAPRAPRAIPMRECSGSTSQRVTQVTPIAGRSRYRGRRAPVSAVHDRTATGRHAPSARRSPLASVSRAHGRGASSFALPRDGQDRSGASRTNPASGRVSDSRYQRGDVPMRTGRLTS